MKKYVNKGLKFIKLSYRCNIINSKIWVKNIIYKKIQIFNKNKSFKIKNIKKFLVNKRLKIKVIQIKTLNMIKSKNSQFALILLILV